MTDAVNNETTPPAGGAPPADNQPWYSAIPDEGLRGYVENKGWKTQADALTAYQGLEKIVSAEKAGKTLVMPDLNNSEEVAAFYSRLGRPADANGYELGKIEGVDPNLANSMSQIMFDAGLGKEQATAIATKYNEMITQLSEQANQQFVQQSENEMAELRKEWGINVDRNTELGRRAVNALGLAQDDIHAMERAIGTKKVMELFYKIGGGLGEGAFAGVGSSNAFGMSPEAARVKIQDLKVDKNWIARYRAGDSSAREEWTRLHKIGYPNG